MPSTSAILQPVAPVSPRSSRRRLLRPPENHRPTAPPGANQRRARTMTLVKDSFDAAVDAESTYVFHVSLRIGRFVWTNFNIFPLLVGYQRLFDP